VLTAASIALCLQDIFFLVAHWIFAIQYFALSKNFSLIQSGQDIAEKEL
jgi:hypothetical protein